MSATQLRLAAPRSLRRRIESALPSAPARTSSRRSVLTGFAMGSVFSAAIAATLLIAVIRADHDRDVLGDVLSAHLKPVASIVYRRRTHVINVFVAPATASDDRAAKLEKVQGFNVRRWSERGLQFWAISDLAVDELQEFGAKIEAAIQPAGGT